MRAIRGLAVAALVALDVSAAAAQPTRHFKDSWFWGLKGGAISYQVQSDANGGLAPLIGADWFITRTNGGLYVAFDHSFFNQFVFVNDSISPIVVTPGGRQVNLKNLRRFTMAGLLFPLQSYRLHPYIGFGAVLSSIATAEPTGTFANPTQQNLVLATVQQFKTGAAPVIILGAQLRLLKSSPFVHASATPANNDFFLFNGGGWRVTLESGLRFNVGTSIDRIR